MGPCGWAISPTSCDGWDGLGPATQDQAITLATGGLWAATGRRFGLCEITVRPARRRPPVPLYQTYPVTHPSGIGRRRCVGSCPCRSRCEAALEGPTRKVDIVEVWVDGEAIPDSAYQVHDGYLLVRVDGECWPTCPDQLQDPPQFEVTYRRGTPLPDDVRAAAEVFACELGKMLAGGECALPAALSRLSRQGVEVTVAEVSSYLDRGLTQIEMVDRVIVAHNPNRLQARPQVWSPDLPPPRVVT